MRRQEARGRVGRSARDNFPGSLAACYALAHNCLVAALVRIVVSATIALAIIVAVIYFGYSR